MTSPGSPEGLENAIRHAENQFPGWVWAIRNSSMHKGDPRPSAIITPAFDASAWYEGYGDTPAEALYAAVKEAVGHQ